MNETPRRAPLAWDELRTFLEVARDGSLSGAARRLGLTQPTVGRHIDALEDALGAILFTRSPRGLSPTAAATALAPHAEAMGVAAAALARTASSAAAIDRGVVRLTASEIMGAEALPAIWDADFLRGPRTPAGDDTWVLCEINASCVSPFPDTAAEAIAETALARVRERRPRRGRVLPRP